MQDTHVVCVNLLIQLVIWFLVYDLTSENATWLMQVDMDFKCSITFLVHGILTCMNLLLSHALHAKHGNGYIVLSCLYVTATEGFMFSLLAFNNKAVITWMLLVCFGLKAVLSIWQISTNEDGNAPGVVFILVLFLQMLFIASLVISSVILTFKFIDRLEQMTITFAMSATWIAFSSSGYLFYPSPHPFLMFYFRACGCLLCLGALLGLGTSLLDSEKFQACFIVFWVGAVLVFIVNILCLCCSTVKPKPVAVSMQEV